MMITQASQIPPRRRARIHAFRLRTMDSGVFMAIDITSVLIHTSLFLFFIGLLIYLFNINHTLFCAVAWFLGISAAAYLIVSLMPLYRIDSPYGSPLSFLLLWPFSGALYAILRILKSVIPAGNIASEHFHRLKTIYSEGFATAFLKSALKPSPNIECQIMDRTIDIMDDRELEWAFERFCDFSSSSSAVVSSIRYLAKSKWSSALEAFSDITFSSDSLLESDRIRRLGLCMMVADLAQLPNAGLHILRQIFDRQHPVLQSIGMGDILRRWNRSNQEIGFCTQILVSGIIANVRNRDDRWVVLASNLLGKSEDEVRGYRDSGDGNVLLANLIHITRQIIRSWKNGQGEAHDLFAYMFRSLSNFDIRNTLPELQDDFLTLWNGIDHTEIRDDLRNLRDVLTQGRDNALAAPPAPDSNLPGHPPDSISLHPRPPSPVASHPTAEPVARRQATVTPVNTPDISSRGQSTVADSTSSHGTSPANLPHSPSPVPGHPTSHPGNGAPPGGASDRSLSQPVAPPAMSPSPPEALERHGAIPGNIADTSSRGQPGSGTESSRASSSVPQSVPSPAASQVASVSDRNGAIIAPLNMHHVPAT
ncbi:hypothetical protein BGW80DRAFT_759609 [Lactifluus volemus]|nr:hypothetical protein BGW80DRAFT_759609 [Lactifluus volemus]